MRRPRGPGGRFLTAEEISAQQFHNGHAASPSTLHHDHVDDEEVLGLDYCTSVPILRPRDSYRHATSVNPIDLDYHPSQSNTPPDHRHLVPLPSPTSPSSSSTTLSAQSIPSPPPPSTPHFYPQPRLQHQHQQHSSQRVIDPGTSTLNLRSHYPATMQMHHIPHPLYPGNLSAVHLHADSSHMDMQRRTEEMISLDT